MNRNILLLIAVLSTFLAGMYGDTHDPLRLGFSGLTAGIVYAFLYSCLVATILGVGTPIYLTFENFRRGRHAVASELIVLVGIGCLGLFLVRNYVTSIVSTPWWLVPLAIAGISLLLFASFQLLRLDRHRFPLKTFAIPPLCDTLLAKLALLAAFPLGSAALATQLSGGLLPPVDSSSSLLSPREPPAGQEWIVAASASRRRHEQQRHDREAAVRLFHQSIARTTTQIEALHALAGRENEGVREMDALVRDLFTLRSNPATGAGELRQRARDVLLGHTELIVLARRHADDPPYRDVQALLADMQDAGSRPERVYADDSIETRRALRARIMKYIAHGDFAPARSHAAVLDRLQPGAGTRLAAYMDVQQGDHPAAARRYLAIGDRPRAVHHWLLVRDYEQAFLAANPTASGRRAVRSDYYSELWATATWVWLSCFLPQSPALESSRPPSDLVSFVVRYQAPPRDVGSRIFGTLVLGVAMSRRDVQQIGVVMAPETADEILAEVKASSLPDKPLITSLVNRMRNGRLPRDPRYLHFPLFAATPPPDNLAE